MSHWATYFLAPLIPSDSTEGVVSYTEFTRVITGQSLSMGIAIQPSLPWGSEKECGEMEASYFFST